MPIVVEFNNSCNSKHVTAGYNAGHRKRLRNRVISSKSSSLLDYEILELLLFSSHLRHDVRPLAKLLIKEFGSFHAVFNSDSDHLRQIRGVNDAVIAIIKAVACAMQLIAKSQFQSKSLLNNWVAVLDYLRLSMGAARKESLRVLFLNKGYKLIEDDWQEFGTVDQTPIYTREIIKRGLAISACSLIICHNHPSGECKPSKGDIRMTRELQQACVSVGIEFIDHIIVVSDEHFSFASNGLL